MSSHPSRLPRLSDAVYDSVYGIRSQLSNFRLSQELLRFFLLSSLALVAMGAADFFWPLHPLVRAAGWIVVLSLAARSLFRWVRTSREIDELLAAREMEAAHPELGQRLRTAYQFDIEEEGLPTPGLASALIEDTNERVKRVDFRDTVNWSRLLPRAAFLAVVGFGIIAVLALWSESRTTLARVLMIPLHYTYLDVEARDSVTAGSDVQFKATVTGRPLDQVELWVRPVGEKEWSKQSMDPVGDAGDQPGLTGELSVTVEDCQKDLEYRVVGHPVASSVYTLKVLQPLTQQAFTASVEPPSYTGLGKTAAKEMDITVPEGSLVSWVIQLSRPAEEARLKSIAGSRLPRLTIDGSKIRADVVQLEESLQYEVEATTEDGIKFVSDRIRIRVKKDRGPAVAFHRPEDQVEVTATTEVGLHLDVSDDFGLGRVGIEYQINGGQKQTLWETDLTGSQEKRLTTMPVVYLEDLQLGHDDAITYYAYAEDNREKPKRTCSQLQFIDIRPYKREYQIVDGQCQGGGGSCLTLEELIARQRHNLRRTFANLDRQPIQETLGRRLATSQTEILEATREFTAGWEMRFGPLPSLPAAASAMEEAAEKLRRRELESALSLEERALAHLVEARQNARKFLKNCSSGQFGQCQKYDNEMVQKLRAPKREPDAANQSLAETREEIQQMAAQQRRFSEQLAPGSGGGQLSKPSPEGAPSSRPASELAQTQLQAAREAEQLREQLGRERSATELTDQRMAEIAETIQRSGAAAEESDAVAAARRALEAAKLLEELDEHLQALGAPDLTERLALAEQMASRLATAEGDVARDLERGAGLPAAQRAGQPAAQNDPLADAQQELSRLTGTLADLLHHLEADALGEHSELRQGLSDLKETHQPQELANAMRRVVDEIRNDRDRAARGARAAAVGLQQIGTDLTALRRGVMQPQLDELLAAEKNAAELLEAIRAGKGQPELAARYEQLQRQLAKLQVSVTPGSNPDGAAAQRRDGGPRAATDGSSSSTSSGSGANVPGAQFRYAGRNVNAEMRIVLDILQRKIQDAILLTARMDADEPVPAKYRGLVDEYYQALSDDLR